MYIGHYTAAAAIMAAAPNTPLLPIAIAVAYPDLLWPLLVLLRKEKVKVNPMDPLQKAIKFTSYPYSHSLVKSAVLTLIPSAVFGVIYQSTWVAIAFWLAAVSHWLLDVVVHVHDLPIFGRKKGDIYVGWGLWKWPKLAFVLEYVFLAVVIILTAAPAAWSGLLIGGFILHALNANSFFGFSKALAPKKDWQYALLPLLGFGLAIWWFVTNWQTA
jgi:hypothetical protein